MPEYSYLNASVTALRKFPIKFPIVGKTNASHSVEIYVNNVILLADD